MNWTRPKSQVEYYSGLCLAATGDIMLLGTSGRGIWRGTDKTDWTLSNEGLDSYSIWDLFATDSFALAATGGWGLFRSTDVGRSWDRVAPDAIRGDVRAILSTGGRLFVGSQDGIIQSLDGGRTWWQKNEGLPYPVSIVSLAVIESTLYAGTGGHGVWKRSLADISLAARAIKHDGIGRGAGRWVKLEAQGRMQGQRWRSGEPASKGIYFRP